MKITVTEADFKQAFRNHDRQENFTWEGLSALFDYLEDFERDTGEEIELDVIELCCEYTEYADLEDFHKDNNAEEYPTIDSIESDTTVIRVDCSGNGDDEDGSFIIQNF